jgi:hypothetical protein
MMALGYAPRVRDVLAYYGDARVERALACAAQGRSVEFYDWPTALEWPAADARGAAGLAACVQRHLQATLRGCIPEDIPPRYPGVHGTLERDIVLEVDDKKSQRNAFAGGKRIRDFLESYDAPYRVKFSGNSSPHFILPRAVYAPQIPGKRWEAVYPRLFGWLLERLRDQVAGKLDDAFLAGQGFLRLPYSLNERTGLVSLPILPQTYDDFEPERAEMQNVRIEMWWFEQEDLLRQREGARRLLRAALGADDLETEGGRSDGKY